jgi:alpha-1,3-mannosyltransferase
VPPYIFPLLVLSKRLHSVFVLRCFNDCFATFFLWLTIYFFQRRSWTFGAAAYAWGLGTKMSLLLVLPAVGVILFLGRGLQGALRLAWLMAQVQIVIAFPFLQSSARAYFGRAFELTRTFKYEWTVNMRMLPEDVFLSSNLSLWLLVAHVLDLFAFLSERWLAPSQKHLVQLMPSLMRFKSPFTKTEEVLTSLRVSPRYVLATMLTANNMGLLFARSLHYQFYAYLAWSTPFLLWHAGCHPLLIYGVWGVQEWAWNVFPSTKASSMVVIFALAFTDRALWVGKLQERVEAEEDEAFGAKGSSSVQGPKARKDK